MKIRKAIPIHHTDISDAPWDGPKNEANLKVNESESYYKKAYAWQDPDKDPATKSAYKFIHHEVSADGTIGKANIKACQAGIAALNGARGGADIPDDDRSGVWRHLATHLQDADIEPAELKSFTNKIEIRSYPFEVRVNKDTEQKRIVGYSAVFEQLSEDLGGFKEKIAKGAFTKSIKNADVRALFNHDPNYVLGRTKNKTLFLTEDDYGLKVEIVPPDTQWAQDLIYLVDRGDIDQMSFGFDTIKDSWDNSDPNNIIRTLEEVNLWDVSIVTYPAYPQTSVSVRTATEVFESYLDSRREQESEIDDTWRELILVKRKKLKLLEKE